MSNSWALAEEIGYNPLTTFWDDFSIAEAFGPSSIKDTAKRAWSEWKDDYKYVTELVMVLNHKCWYWNEHNDNLMELYSNLYYEYNDKLYDFYKNDKKALDYIFHTLD